MSAARIGLRRWHRRIAWVALFAACTFALTGLLHPLMTRLQVKPLQMKPPPMPLLAEALPAPAALLLAAGIAEVQGLRVVHDGARWLWRVETAGGRRYLDAASGIPRGAETERAHAERLARWYAGENGAVTGARLLTAFDADYGYVNRLLPVWRVDFARDDGLSVYVSTEDDRLATMSDRRKRVFQQMFRAVHSWAWLPAPLRNGWINALLLGVAVTVLLGLTLALRTPGGRGFTLRRAHRWGGIAVSLAVLGWALSGFVQAWGNAARERAAAARRPMLVASASLSAALVPPQETASGVALVSVDGAPAWRWALQPPANTTGQGLAMGEHQAHGRPPLGVGAAAAHYVRAADGTVLAEGETRHLTELARFFEAGGNPAAATPVAKFTPDYGFLFKRLPVWRIEGGDAAHTTSFVDTASERLAARIDDGDRRAGALFAYLHKWEWITPLAGKDWRDGISAGFAALLIAVAIGGTLLRRRSRARQVVPPDR